MATRIPTMYGRYYVISLVWRGRQFTVTVFRDKLGKLQRPQAQKIADKVYPGSRVINFHESDPTSDPVLLVKEAREKFILEAKKNCGEGKYYCFDEQKCKPLPDGMTIGKDGMLQKEGVNKNKNCGCGKKPCITYGSYDDTPSDNPSGQTGEDAADGMSEQHYGAAVNKIPKELDAAVKMHASQSQRLKNSKEFKKDAGKEANKIPAELDKAVAMHKSQAKRLRAAAVKEEAPKGKKYERMIKHIKKSYAKDGALTKDEKSIAYATAWKHKNKNQDRRLGETYFYAGDSKEEFKDKAMKKKQNKEKKKSVVPSTDVPTFPQDQVSEDWQKKSGKSPSGGLNEKGRKSYERQNPGSDLKAPVTGKVKKGGKAAGRRASFCARMKGMKKRLTSAKTARDPDSRINKSLRKWKC
mgnify:CR=1 FL=1